MTVGGSCMGTKMDCVDGDDDIKGGNGGLKIAYVVADVF